MSEIAHLLVQQDGLVSRRQSLAAGLTTVEVNRLVRRREWVIVHPGVYVNHTGPLSWVQRAWAAVLYSWPAALTHESAVRAADGPGRRGHDDSTIHVAVEPARPSRPTAVLATTGRRHATIKPTYSRATTRCR